MAFVAQRDQTREQQIEEAAKYAGVPAAVIDGIWRTETGRGTHKTMVGPETKWGTAKGHFQQLDYIVAEWSKRLGRQLDPFDFSDGLTMAAEQLKESRERYGNVPDAVSAYHGGTNKKNWGKNTRAYLAHVMGRDTPASVPSTVIPQKGRTVPVFDDQGKKPHLPAEQVWTAADAADLARADGAFGRGGEYKRAFDLIGDDGSLLDARRIEMARAQAQQSEIDQRGFFGDVLPAAYKVTMRPTGRLMERIFAAPGDYAQDEEFMRANRDNWAASVQGFAESHEQEFLLNAQNPADYVQRRQHLEKQRKDSLIVAQDGMRGWAAMFLAGAGDPTTYLTGYGALKTMAMTGRGAIQLARAGRTSAAIGSAVVENAAGNIAYEAVQAAMGEHRGLSDYAMAGVMGLLPAALQTPGLRKAAHANQIMKQVQESAKRDVDTFESVVRDLGEDASTKDILAEVERREVERLEEEVEDVRGGRGAAADTDVTMRDPTSPEAIKEAQAELDAEAELRDVEAKEVQPAKDTAQPEAQPAAEPSDFNDKLPRTLSKADPRYSFGDKKFQITFARDLDKALYLLADGAKRSKADADYLKWVQDLSGLSEKDIRAMGAAVRAEIKAIAKDAEPGKLAFESSLFKDGGPALKVGATSVMDWRPKTHTEARGGRTYQEFIESVATDDTATPALKSAAALLLKLADSKVWGMPTKLSGNARENVRHDGMATMRKSSDAFTKVHEAVHVATIRPIEQFLRGNLDGLGKQTKAGLKRLDKLYTELKKEWETEQGRKVSKDPSDRVEYAFKDLHEFAAQAMSDKDFQAYLAGKQGEATKAINRFKEFLEAVAEVLGIKTQGTKLEEVVEALSEVLTARDTIYKDATGKATSYAPKPPHPADVAFDKKYGLDGIDTSDAMGRAKVKAMRSMLREMEDWARKNPKNDLKSSTIMDDLKVANLATPATLLAQAEHPAARWVAAVLLEQTMGAGGRRSNAAIAAHTLAQEYAGNFTNNFDNLYATWRNERVGLVKGASDDVWKNDLRRQFNREVAEEIEGRLLGYPPSDSVQVRNAANLAEKQFELMRLEQIAYGTPGFGGLPTTSRGYLPHLLDSAKVAKMTDAQRRAYTMALKDQFMNGLEDMDEVFAEKVAKAYVKHATDRAAGLSDIPADPLNHRAAEYIREAAKAAGMDHAELRLLEHKLNKGAASHTKKRLKMDTLKKYTAEDGTTFKLMDLFKTDMNDIVRGHARRVAGEVALTKFGVPGSAGLQLIREMLSVSRDMALTPDQTRAMKQTFSELLGRPVDLSEESMALNGLMTYASLTKLGGMGFTQLGEYSNMVLHLGLGHTMSAIGGVPRLLNEVRTLARGGKVDNSILGSMEFRGGGGEFGTEGYRISKFDTTGREHEAYGQSSAGPGTRLLKTMRYGMGAISFQRALQGVQQRGAAEQIVLKVWRKINAGEDLGVALKDMGFTDDVVGRLRIYMADAVEFSNGRVKTFDITKLPQELQTQFDQSTRRGVAQIIQGSFIGERGHWEHSQTGRLISQFRNYPLLAMEKQAGRTYAIHGGGLKGAAMVGGMIIAAAGMVLPVYAARVAYNAMTRDDRDEYIERMFSPQEVLKNIMNYIALTGLMQDVVQGLFAVGGSLNEDWGWMEGSGGREGVGQTTLGSIIPAVGSIEELMKLPANTDNAHKLFRALPYSNTPALIPFIEALRK